MKTYWFEIILRSHPQSFDDLAEASFEAGCDDGTVSQRDSITTIGFARQSSSLDDAVGRAVSQLESIGCVIERIEIENLDAIRTVA